MTTDYSHLVTDKSVALVGPAKYMIGSKLGREIGDHQTVIRINRGIESVSEYREDIRTRTDILYSCLIERAQQAGSLDPGTLAHKYGIKWIVAPPESDMKGVSRRTAFHSLVDTKKVCEIKRLIPVSLVSHKFHTELAKKVNCKPNTGFVAIYDLARLQPARLSLYGFSFYLDGFIPGQKSGVEKEKNCSEQEFADMAFNSKRHVQKNMWDYARKTLPNFDFVKTDRVLSKILKMGTFSRDVFQSETIT